MVIGGGGFVRGDGKDGNVSEGCGGDDCGGGGWGSIDGEGDFKGGSSDCYIYIWCFNN